MTVMVLISHFRGMLIVIFRRINCNEEQQVINCCFLADSVLKFSTEIDIFINCPETEFLNFSIVLFTAALRKRKQTLCKAFDHRV